jgi:hypothetical protein
MSLLHSQIEESKQEIDRLNKQLYELKEKNQELSTKTNSPLSASISGKSDSAFNRLTSSKSIDLSSNFILRQVENIESSILSDENKSNKSVEELLSESFSSSANLNVSTSIIDTKTLMEHMDSLKSDLNKGKLQLMHLNELLNESELNNSRLTEQIVVLKEEIRRLII